MLGGIAHNSLYPPKLADNVHIIAPLFRFYEATPLYPPVEEYCALPALFVQSVNNKKTAQGKSETRLFSWLSPPSILRCF
jgi:hypothetical protein